MNTIGDILRSKTVNPAITLTQGDVTFALTEDERAIVLRGTLPEPLVQRFRRLGLRLHVQGTTRVDLTIQQPTRTIRTALYITGHRTAELMRARAGARSG